MRQLEPYLLWLGHSGDLRDVSNVLAVGIQAAVQLAAEEPAVQFTRDITFVRIPIHDGSGNPVWQLRLAVEIVSQLLATQVPTLVCCGAGLSRSRAIAACAIASTEGRPAVECIKVIREMQPVDVSPGLWQDLMASGY